MVTACLITWKRQHNIPKIVEHLQKYPFIDEILIRDNSKGENLKTWARYQLSQQAKNETIYVQDDDCLVDVQKLYDAYNGSGITYGATMESIEGSYHPRLCLVGWGAIFKRDWTGVFEDYLDVYPEDYLFYREADRIFTVMQPRAHKPVLLDIQHMNEYDDAMSSQDEHVQTRNEAVNRCLNLVQ